jgi:serine/threonine protein kinase
MILEYCQYADLNSQISIKHKLRSHFPELVIIQWLREIVTALTSLHEKGAVHMDIKPSNIFVKRKGHLRVGDFGSCMMLLELIGSLK